MPRPVLDKAAIERGGGAYRAGGSLEWDFYGETGCRGGSEEAGDRGFLQHGCPFLLLWKYVRGGRFSTDRAKRNS